MPFPLPRTPFPLCLPGKLVPVFCLGPRERPSPWPSWTHRQRIPSVFSTPASPCPALCHTTSHSLLLVICLHGYLSLWTLEGGDGDLCISSLQKPSRNRAPGRSPANDMLTGWNHSYNGLRGAEAEGDGLALASRALPSRVTPL